MDKYYIDLLNKTYLDNRKILQYSFKSYKEILDYEIKMIELNNIKGFSRILVEDTKIKYDITDTYSLEELMRKGGVKLESIITILKLINKSLSELDQYLLDKNKVIINAQNIYCNSGCDQIKLIYFPINKKMENNYFIEFKVLCKRFIKYLRDSEFIAIDDTKSCLNNIITADHFLEIEDIINDFENSNFRDETNNFKNDYEKIDVIERLYSEKRHADKEKNQESEIKTEKIDKDVDINNTYISVIEEEYKDLELFDDYELEESDDDKEFEEYNQIKEYDKKSDYKKKNKSLIIQSILAMTLGSLSLLYSKNDKIGFVVMLFFMFLLALSIVAILVYKNDKNEGTELGE